MAGKARWIVTALALAVLGGVSVAQEAARIEPRADKILRIMSELLAEAEQFTVHNDQTSDEEMLSGELAELSSSVDVAVRRPGELHAVLHGDLRPMRYWIGGGRIAVMDVMRWTYAVASVPEDLDAAIDAVWERYDMKIPLADFVSGRVYDNLTRGVESGVYAGLHEVDGVRCHHLVFSQSDIDWQIWIDDGMLPLPRKLLITYKNEPGAPRYTARLSEWELSPDLGNTIFDFEPPEDAEQIEFADRAAQAEE